MSLNNDFIRTGLNWWQLKRLRAIQLLMQDFRCDNCGLDLLQKKGFYELHHIDRNPKNNIHENLVVYCKGCHQDLHLLD